MKSFISFLCVLTIAAFTADASYHPVIPKYQSVYDARLHALNDFFNAHHFVRPYYTKDYLACADESGLDWRLVPTIALLESGGGKRYPVSSNNLWGWGSGSIAFGSIPDGICYVSGQLANGPYYRGKTIEQKVKTYNSINSSYWPHVQQLMESIK